jgi:thioredoxin 1
MTPDTVTFVKIDIDENPDLAQQWDVTGVPVMIKIENDKELARLVGYRSENAVREFAHPNSDVR